MAAQRLFCQHGKVDALDSARRSGETALNDLVAQPQGLKYLSSLVGLQRRDAHLGHDFQHALGDALAVSRNDGVVIDELLGVQQPVAAGLPKRFKTHVWVDGIGAEADQQAVMVHLSRFTRLDDDSNLSALVDAD